MTRLLMLGVGGGTASAGGGAAGSFYGAQVEKSSTQSAADYTAGVVISWAQAQFDTNSFWSAGSPTKLIVPSAVNGMYGSVLCNVWVDAMGATTNNAALAILRGAGNFVGMAGFRRGRLGGNGEGTSGIFIQCRTQPVLLTTGDEFTAYLQLFGDSSVNIEAARTSFGIYIAGASAPGVLVSDASGTTGQNYNFGAVSTWDTTAYDPHGFWSGGSPSRLTVPAGVNGRYGIVKGNVLLGNVSASQNMSMNIMKNGTGTGAGAGWPGIGNNVTRPGSNDSGGLSWLECESQPVLLTTGDYYELSLSCGDTSTDMNSNSSFGIELMPTSFRGVLCSQTSDQAAANYSTGAQLPFDGEIYDTDAAHDTVTNNHQIIIPAALNGKYGMLLGNMLSSNLTTSSSGAMSIRRGGSGNYDGFGGSGGDFGSFTNNWLQCRSQIVQLATGDAYTAQTFINDSSITVEAEATTFGLRVLPEV